MKLKLIALEPELLSAFEEAFESLEVEIIQGRFEDVEEYDCLVSPANSFGLMDGGMDLAITNYFGKQLEARVQKVILREYLGEQPVGTSFVVDTKHSTHPFLAHTPTMRVPEVIKRNDVSYSAMRAMLLAVSKNPEIKTILCPGLGTGCGKIPYKVAAHQMALAYKQYLSPIKEINWQVAKKIQVEINQIWSDYYVKQSWKNYQLS